jgi:hypothetical protein
MSTTAMSDTALANAPPAHVQQVVRSAEEQLAGLLRQKAEITRRIGTVKQLLAGMANLFGDSVLEGDLLTLLNRGAPQRRRGFTQACRQVLMESQTPLRARRACAELQRRFPELVLHHKDLVASVTTVLHRLVEYGEARCFSDNQGVKVWEWVTDQGLIAPEIALHPEAAPQDPAA